MNELDRAVNTLLRALARAQHGDCPRCVYFGTERDRETGLGYPACCWLTMQPRPYPTRRPDGEPLPDAGTCSRFVSSE